MCPRCGGFLGESDAACPHCAARPRRRRRWAVALGLVGSASLGLTMMACYGGPPCEPGHNGCRAPQGANKDANKDSNKDVSKAAKPDARVKL
jgi:hypothetical protein